MVKYKSELATCSVEQNDNSLEIRSIEQRCDRNQETDYKWPMLTNKRNYRRIISLWVS